MNGAQTRPENSVQMSLARLRELHTTRVETAKELAEQRSLELEARRLEAEKQRLAEERALEEQRQNAEYERERQRIAAQNELELAKERARADADARVREKQVELQIKQAESELLKAQALMPNKPRSWLGITVVAGLLLALQGGMFWRAKQSDERLERVSHALGDARADAQARLQTLHALENSLSEARRALAENQAQAAALRDRLDALEESGRSSRGTRPTRTRPTHRPTTPVTEPPGPVVARCLDSPLCPD